MSSHREESSAKTSRHRAARTIVCISLWAALFLVLLHFDVSLMRWRYSVLGDGPKGLLLHLLNNLREFGQLVCVVVVLIIVVTYDRRWKSIVVAVLLAQGLAAVIYNPGKLLIVRYRPQPAIEALATTEKSDKVAALSTFTSRDTWLGWRPGNYSVETQSFPSGHAAGAFALAGVLAWGYPRLGWLFWTLAVGCAASRYLTAVHWPSDCLAGAALGHLAARLVVGLVTICAHSRSRRATTPAP